MPSGLSSLPPVSSASSIRPVSAVQPPGSHLAARPFVAPSIVQQVQAAAALFAISDPATATPHEPAPIYADPALLNRFGGLVADVATRKAAERPAARRPLARDAEAARRQMRLYGVERLADDPPPMDLEA